MEYQVQINSIKAKLQETRARKKQQEELIMKVENQALKVCFFFVFFSQTPSTDLEIITWGWARRQKSHTYILSVFPLFCFR